MAKQSRGGLRHRMGRAWDKLTESSSPPTVPLQSSSSAPTTFVASPSGVASGSFNTPAQVSQASLPSSPPERSALPPSPPTPPTSALLALPPARPTPSLQIPSVLQVQSTLSPSSGSAIWTGLATALRTLHTNSIMFPPLHSAIGGLLICVESIEGSTRNRKEYETLAFELKTLSETLDRHLQGSKTFPMLDFVAKTVQLIQEQVNIIARIEKNSPARRAFETQEVRDALLACDRHIQTLSRQIQNIKLEAMKPAKLAMYDSSIATDVNRRACTKNTRTGVLSDLETWLADPQSPNVCWMNGMAGTGKTTIAYTFVRSLEERNLLGASFFCTRTTEECRDVTRIVPTIAYQLARRSTRFQYSLCQVLSDDPDVLSRTMATQFERLLKEPFMEVKDMLSKRLVVVIDALDECTAANGVELVLNALLQAASSLPLKFLVVSRPEPSIRNAILDQALSTRLVYELHSVSKSDVQSDIKLFLRVELPSISQSQVERLAELSGSLFIYAATVVRYIQAGKITGDFEERLDMMLSATSASDGTHSEIDQLYMTILSVADKIFVKKDSKDLMRLVLWSAVCAREPVSVEILAVLAGINDSGKTLAMLQPLRSVLCVSEDSDIVTILHASFPDFLFSQARSGSFFCDTGEINQLIARSCFTVLERELRFNICGLESSYVPDEKLPKLNERIETAISGTLTYTCRFWGDHLQHASDSSYVCYQLQGFLSQGLLFWMEVMNLRQWMGIGVRMIMAARLWLRTNYPLLLGLSKLAEDAWDFVTGFAANPISQSTPHIYVSALALCHRSSTIYKHYWGRTRGLIEPKGAGIEQREVTLITRWKFDSPVNSVAYSPDGTRLAFGCVSGSIVIQDAYDGNLIGGDFTGHTDNVMSVAFSPDSTRIVSGSLDRTIRVWNVQNNNSISSCLVGHAGSVASVVFSPDGSLIASGSHDCTIRLWNVRDGTSACTPFEGHTDGVTSVAFFSHGKLVVSGSDDCTLRIWHAENGSIAGPPLEGHADAITSVGISSDDAYIVSGSYDQTICVWNVRDSTLIYALEGHNDPVMVAAFSPDGTHIVSSGLSGTIWAWDVHADVPGVPVFKGHTESIGCLVFSPDGTRVVSASWDSTVCVWNFEGIRHNEALFSRFHTAFWSLSLSPNGTFIACGFENGTIRILNAHDGTFIGAPLEGHTRRVDAVTFSPDTAQIVSGSNDRTVCIWRVQDGALLGDPLQGHPQGVLSVALSPRGSHIVSGSYDGTIRLWGKKDGAYTCSVLEGHTNWVNSVVFSPDGARIVSGSTDATIRMWNVLDGSSADLPFKGHTEKVCSLSFSPDGTTIASASNDQTVRVWNANNGTPAAAPFLGHTNWVVSVAFSPDGSRIVSGSDDFTIRVWNAQDGTNVTGPLMGHAEYVRSVAFSPDGAYIFSCSETSIRIWSLCSSAPEIDVWTVAEDGWVQGRDDKLLFWLPHDVATILPTPFNPWVADASGPIQADYSNLLLGEEWKKCYITG